MESMSYVRSLRMVFFYLVTTYGQIFLHQLRRIMREFISIQFNQSIIFVDIVSHIQRIGCQPEKTTL